MFRLLYVSTRIQAGFRIDAWSSISDWLIVIKRRFDWLIAPISQNQFQNSTTDLKEVWNKSFYSNIGSTYSRYYDYCNTFQAIDEDYKGNTGDLNIDRGHLLPNGIVNQASYHIGYIL